MSAAKIYLTTEEQIYLMEMLELNDPRDAAEKFVKILIEERVDPQQMNKFLKAIIKRSLG